VESKVVCVESELVRAESMLVHTDYGYKVTIIRDYIQNISLFL